MSKTEKREARERARLAAQKRRLRSQNARARALSDDAALREAAKAFGVSDEAEWAYADLMHGIALSREKHEAVPCVGPGADAWTSDDATDQELAADLCLLCPVFTLCQRYADEAQPEAGTWAGVTRDPVKDQLGRLRQRKPGVCIRGLHDVTRPGAVYTSPRGRKECAECRNARQHRDTRIAERQRPPRTGRRWNPGARECRCGCAGATKGGNYLPGHDSQHLARLRSEVRGGRSLDEALVEVAHSERLGTKLRAWLEKS